MLVLGYIERPVFALGNAEFRSEVNLKGV